MADGNADALRIRVEEADAARLAPFGWMLASRADIPGRRLNFYPGEMRSPCSFVTDAQADISVVRVA